jgi:YVTN family beta-propeller protein
MNRSIVATLAALMAAGAAFGQEPADPGAQLQIGPAPDGQGVIASTLQRLRPAGTAAEFPGRPVDVALAPDGQTLYAKDNRGLVVFDAADGFALKQELAFPDKSGGSMHGIAVSKDGKTVWATTAQNNLHEAKVGDDGQLAWSRAILLPGPKAGEPVHAAGIAVSADEKTLYVALSRNNSVGVIDLVEGKLVDQIPVAVAPFDIVLSADEKALYVSNWGGRRPKEGEATADSSGTPVLIDERGVAKSGTVGKVDLAGKRMTIETATGLHPADLVLDEKANRLYAANANSDTVSVLDAETMQEIESILVRPDPELPFGSMTNALALAPDGKTLYAANAGNNAVAVVRLSAEAGKPSAIAGFIPTAWYPGALALSADGATLFVANVKGFGSRDQKGPAEKGRSVYWFSGVVSKVAVPDGPALAAMTEQVKTDARVPQALRSWERQSAAAEVKPVPVPRRVGDPSVFEHVVYVIKENRTYDQVFGDFPQGNGDPNLCMFPREITPNHHAIAEKFVLLDNYYCNGVNSADGHSWTTEGNVTDHLEKAFGGFTRSYTYGDDPLTYSSTGFIWDSVLLRGLSFRNYGEFDYSETVPADASFKQVYDDFVSGKNEIQFKQKIGIDKLRAYSSPSTPGWNMNVPDVLRVDRFLQEFREYEKNGDWPNFTILHLPQDHNSGTSPEMPTPNAHMADNDLAVGRLIEALSRSKYWPKTCVFIIEDDPQNGFDHVDGHRSICLVASPYTKRGAVVSHFYNQTSVLHTIGRIFGCPPMNQMDASAPLMYDCFTEEPDFSPFVALPANVPLDELNKPLALLGPEERRWAERSLAQDFGGPDRIEDDVLNRILWHYSKGLRTPYPEALSGPHGTGLKDQKLAISEEDEEEEEEEEGERERAREGRKASGEPDDDDGRD